MLKRTFVWLCIIVILGSVLIASLLLAENEHDLRIRNITAEAQGDDIRTVTLGQVIHITDYHCNFFHGITEWNGEYTIAIGHRYGASSGSSNMFIQIEKGTEIMLLNTKITIKDWSKEVTLSLKDYHGLINLLIKHVTVGGKKIK